MNVSEVCATQLLTKLIYKSKLRPQPKKWTIRAYIKLKNITSLREKIN